MHRGTITRLARRGLVAARGAACLLRAWTRYRVRNLRGLACPICHDHGTWQTHGGGKQYGCGCWFGHRVAQHHPQGWVHYPGDICRHGTYVGGCGPDWTCGACIQYDEAGGDPKLTLRERLEDLLYVARTAQKHRRERTVVALSNEYLATAGRKNRRVARRLSVLLGMHIPPREVMEIGPTASHDVGGEPWRSDQQ